MDVSHRDRLLARHRRELDRDAVQDRVAREGVDGDSSASMLLFAPACAAATLILASGSSWPQPCGMLTTPGMIPSVTSTGTSIEPRSDVTCARPPSSSPSRSASSGWTCAVQRSLPAHEVGDVVHPGVVRAQLAAADQHHAAVAVRARATRAGARRRATIGSGASSILPLARAQHLGDARLERAEVDAVRRCLQPREREAVGVGAEAGRRTGRTRSIQSSTRSGPRRGSSAAISSSGRGPRAARPGPAARAATSCPSTKSSSASTSASGPARRRCRPAAAASATRRSAPRSSSSTGGE